jgi:AmiR/NasT family two-component response regulator
MAMTSADRVFITDPSDPTDDYTAALEEALAAIIDVTERFEARKVITHAKELLMVHRTMTEPQAYRWIQKTAMDRRASMLSIAETIIQRFDENATRAG